MNFLLDRVNKGDGRTFSEAGILSFFMALNDWLNKSMACLIHKGFKNDKPIEKLEIDLAIKVNNKFVSSDELDEVIQTYPNLIGFSYKALLETLQKKAEEGK